MPKKVLIVYASGGMGHITAAKAIEKAFSAKRPEIIIKNINVIDFAPQWYAKLFVDGYNFISAKIPKLWGWLYSKHNKPANQGFAKNLSQKAIEKKFIAFVQEFQPDFIISTHPLPMMLISSSKRKDIIDIYSSMVITDFGCHSLWVDSEVNYYFAATPDVQKCLANYGVRPEQVIITGIPIDLKFSIPLAKETLVKKLGLKPNIFTLLIVGGQFDFMVLKKIIKGIERKNNNIQFIVVAGRDKYLKEALDKSSLHQNPRVKVFGFVDNMEELMTVSDLIFSKAGGLTVSECMAKGLPMIINKVIPGQEEDNLTYLASKKAVLKAQNPPAIIEAVAKLAANPKKLKLMKQAAQKIGRPDSATELVNFVYQKIQQ